MGEVLTVTHAALEPYTPDGFVLALAQVMASAKPDVVALAHTYQARDFAPMLAARLNLPLVTDVTAIKGTGRQATFTRPMFQGKLAAEVKPVGNSTWLITFQIGAFRADALKKGAAPAAVTRAVSAGLMEGGDDEPDELDDQPQPPLVVAASPGHGRLPRRRQFHRPLGEVLDVGAPRDRVQ